MRADPALPDCGGSVGFALYEPRYGDPAQVDSGLREIANVLDSPTMFVTLSIHEADDFLAFRLFAHSNTIRLSVFILPVDSVTSHACKMLQDDRGFTLIDNRYLANAAPTNTAPGQPSCFITRRKDHSYLIVPNYKQIAISSVNRKDHDRAREFYEKALDLPFLRDDVQLLNNYGVFLWRVDHDLALAQKMLERAIKANPTHVLARRNLARVVRLTGKLDSATTLGPCLVFEKSEVDLGTVEEGTTKTAAFPFINLGDAPVMILKIKKSCGCTSVTVKPDTLIAAKEEGTVEIVFDATGRQRQQRHGAMLITNDPGLPKVTVTARAFVKAEIELDPRRLYFGRMTPGSIRPRKLLVRNKSRQPLTLLEVELSSQDFAATASLAPRPLPAAPSSGTLRQKRERYVVEVASRPTLRPGRFSEKLVIHTNNEKKPRLVVPVEGSLVSDISTTPSRVFFGFVRVGDTNASRTLTIASLSRTPFRVTEVERGSLPVEVRWAREKESDAHEVEVRLSPEVTGARQVRGILRFHTTSEEKPTIEVPVFALVRR